MTDVIDMPWCEHCECWHHVEASCIQKIEPIISGRAWFITACIATFAIFFVLTSAYGDACLKEPDENITKKSGYRWQYRTVDGKRCWYYSNRVMPREDLVWSFTEEEFNVDIDRVIERKFYFPENRNGADR